MLDYRDYRWNICVCTCLKNFYLFITKFFPSYLFFWVNMFHDGSPPPQALRDQARVLNSEPIAPEPIIEFQKNF